MMQLLFVLAVILYLTNASIQRSMKHVTNDTDYWLKRHGDTITLYKPLLQHGSTVGNECIIGRIIMQAGALNINTSNDYFTIMFPEQIAVMITKVTPQSDDLSLTMKQYPNEHYFFFSSLENSPNNN